jgi:hypothetical protein
MYDKLIIPPCYGRWHHRTGQEVPYNHLGVALSQKENSHSKQDKQLGRSRELEIKILFGPRFLCTTRIQGSLEIQEGCETVSI